MYVYLHQAEDNLIDFSLLRKLVMKEITISDDFFSVIFSMKSYNKFFLNILVSH